ncbi:MAG TPA: nucleotidyl transferase AbiEii/AbiGii toxin family protein [Candidatus Aminicenantes bacterium]|nr:nucleotidyl transferase AbiEii/AbiGii toxin family protein [Candidatus Aminicenantes bacterium]
MKPITRQDILAHQSAVSWAEPYQVEQDLLLCQAMVALFDDDFLSSQIAMRGGTLLHKVQLAPAARYSEDIDLVVVGPRPADHIRLAIRRVLADVLGAPKKSVWDTLVLTIRNTIQPSSILRMTYSMASIIEPSRTLGIVVEANVTERIPHRAVIAIPFSFPFRGKNVQTRLKGFEIHEMLGTKMRALFQRKRGRDLFDLYWALTQSPTPIKPEEVLASFQHYLSLEGTEARREELVSILDTHLKDREFCSDTEGLLRADISYDPQLAGGYIKSHLLKLLSK